MRALLGLPIVVSALVACHAPNLPLRTDPAPPAGSTTFESHGLFARHWAPPDGTPPRALLVIVHGLKDYSARYARTATRLAHDGFSVYALDLPGHGLSPGERVSQPVSQYAEAVDRFVTDVETREPGKPVFLFGHSMGGAVATLVAERHTPTIAGLALSGPALAVDAPPLLVAATQMAGALTPFAPALDLPNKNFSSDPANAHVMDTDPLVYQPKASAAFAAGLIDAIGDVWHGTDHLTMPILAMHGTADKLTAPSGSRALIAAAPATDKTLKLYAGANHDLLHEPNGTGDHVENDLAAWLAAHTGGAPAPMTAPAIPVSPAAPLDTTTHLSGDPRGWTQLVELDGGRPEARAEILLARPRPLGWSGDLAYSYAKSTVHSLTALRPIGAAVNLDGVAIGATAGIALHDVDSLRYFTARAYIEAPLDALHFGFHGELYRHAGANLYRVDAAMRLFGDRAYWPHARAGVGPVLTGGLQAGDGIATSLIFLVGLQLYGTD